MNYRRLRSNPWIRNLVKEVRLSHEQMMQPVFTVENLKERQPITGLTGVHRDTSQTVLRQIEMDLEKGVRSFLLFGVPAMKTEKNFSANFTAKTISEIRKRFGSDLLLFVDVCVCSHTSHGQCGVLNPEGDHVLNSETVDELAALATAYAEAGADGVAPSDMMDGRVSAIRKSLDDQGLEKALIMSYSAKFHSAFYGPFREAADSAPKEMADRPVLLKDRATYQIDPTRLTDAILSSDRDWKEGADILMVKPGLPYLDALKTLSDKITAPWAVYEVSGEYAAIELLAEKGLMDARRGHIEAWTALTRAGAQIIISYGARNAKEWLG